MEKLKSFSSKWYFFAILVLAQFVLMPFSSRNFNPMNSGYVVSMTLSNAPQVHLGSLNILFQSLSLLLLILLLVLKDKFRKPFNIYVAVSYLSFAFIQNVAITEEFGFSMVTVNVVMFLMVAYVWIREVLHSENHFDFSNLSWKYSWMIVLALFAYLCPFNQQGQLDFNLLHFFNRNTATAFCLTTPLFLTILTLNLPKINIVSYRITAVIGFIVGIYNMASFFNPYTIWVGVLHLPLLIISLYCAILSYIPKKTK